MRFSLTHVLDGNNFPLWDMLQQEYVILQEWHDGRHFFYRLQENVLELHLPLQGISYELFTLELGRLCLMAKKNIYLTGCLLTCYHEKPLLSWSFNSDNLFAQIGTLLEDYKLVTLVKQWGCHSFRRSTDPAQAISFAGTVIGKAFSGSKNKPAVVHLYIYAFFALATSPILPPEQAALDRLKMLCPALFLILDNFFTQWQAFDIERYHPEKYSYKPLVRRFIDTLSLWTLIHLHLPAAGPAMAE
jgi:hypothetical protein